MLCLSSSLFVFMRLFGSFVDCLFCFLLVKLPVCLFVCLSVCLRLSLSICRFVCLFAWLSFGLSIRPSFSNLMSCVVSFFFSPVRPSVVLCVPVFELMIMVVCCCFRVRSVVDRPVCSFDCLV